MNVHRVKFEERLEQDWDHFVFTKARNSTFLHSRKFFNYNYLNQQDDASLLFYKKDKLVALFPANAYRKNEQLILHSYLRSTYGGIVFSEDCTVADLIEVVDLIIEYARESGCNEIIVRPTFGIYQRMLAYEQDYLLWKAGFGISARELELAIQLTNDFETRYADSTKRSIKKALKSNVLVRQTDDIASYWDLLERNLSERYNKKPVHTLDEIKKLQELVGQEKVRIYAAYFQDRMIAGILAFAANPLVLHAQYIASDSKFQDLRPLNAVIDYISKVAQKDGFQYFNLGMVSEPGGTELNEGLCRFKEGFGAMGVLRETMHLRLNSEHSHG